MKMEDYINEIKLELTGGVLELELPDATLSQVVTKALRELQRYITSNQLITIPYASCIDTSGFKISAVTHVYRSEGMASDDSRNVTDPMYAQMWMAFTNGGTMYNLNEYVSNYLSYSTLLQMRNTVSTDLAYIYDKQAEKLYINISDAIPAAITIEYIPLLDNVEDVKSDYWIDILMRLSVALTKQILGKIRSRYKQSNALWTMDGDQMTEEGNAEIQALREQLNSNSQLCYPID